MSLFQRREDGGRASSRAISRWLSGAIPTGFARKSAWHPGGSASDTSRSITYVENNEHVFDDNFTPIRHHHLCALRVSAVQLRKILQLCVDVVGARMFREFALCRAALWKLYEA